MADEITEVAVRNGDTFVILAEEKSTPGVFEPKVNPVATPLGGKYWTSRTLPADVVKRVDADILYSFIFFLFPRSNPLHKI
jgi:hypothetical protein